MIKYAYPVMLFAVMVLILPHGFAEVLSMVGVLTTGGLALWKVTKG